MAIESWNSGLLSFGSGLLLFPNSQGSLPGKTGLKNPMIHQCMVFQVRGCDSRMAKAGSELGGEFCDSGEPRQGKEEPPDPSDLQILQTTPSLSTLALQGVNRGGETGRVYRKDTKKRRMGK